MDTRDKATFLEKFKGKTSVIGKQGITHLLQHNDHEQPPSSSRRPSVNRQRMPPLAPLPKPVNLDNIIPSEPRQQITSRRSSDHHPPEQKQKDKYIPSFGVSRSSSVAEGNGASLKQDPRGSVRQQLSRYNDYSLEKQLIGTNTKISEDAMKHLQFLNFIETKMKKS